LKSIKNPKGTLQWMHFFFKDHQRIDLQNFYHAPPASFMIPELVVMKSKRESFLKENHSQKRIILN